MESVFIARFCPSEAKVRFTTFLLCDGARDWWVEVIQDLRLGTIKSMNWEDIVTTFKRDFLPTIEVQQLTREYLVLKQTIELVTKITFKFRKRSSLCP